jgi:hypothetical protein
VRLDLIEVEVQHSEARELTQAVWQRRDLIASEVQLLEVRELAQAVWQTHQLRMSAM